jgi:hypothetical protein
MWVPRTTLTGGRKVYKLIENKMFYYKKMEKKKLFQTFSKYFPNSPAVAELLPAVCRH